MYKSLPELSYDSTIFARYKNQVRSCYHEDIQNRDTLFISMGDSWTWGDSLHGINMQGPNIDDPKRLTTIYGYLISKKLNADFINCARCGGSNLFVYNLLSKILQHNNDRYKNIVVVITLTENCRELEQSRKWLSSADTLTNMLRQYERNMFLDFARIFSNYKKVKFILGRNFTHSFVDNIEYIEKYHVPKIWTELLAEHQSIESYPSDIRYMTNSASEPILLTVNSLNLDFKDEMIDELDKSLKAISWLEESKLNYKLGSKHPVPIGHDIWANYLLQFI